MHFGRELSAKERSRLGYKEKWAERRLSPMGRRCPSRSPGTTPCRRGIGPGDRGAANVPPPQSAMPAWLFFVSKNLEHPLAQGPLTGKKKQTRGMSPRPVLRFYISSVASNAHFDHPCSYVGWMRVKALLSTRKSCPVRLSFQMGEKNCGPGPFAGSSETSSSTRS